MVPFFYTCNLIAATVSVKGSLALDIFQRGYYIAADIA